MSRPSLLNNNNTPRDTTDKYRYGYATGADLLAKPILNLNPYDIQSVNGAPPAYVWEKWRFFSGFVKEKLSRDNITTAINSERGKQITLDYIEEFNSNPDTSAWIKRFGSVYPYRGLNNRMTTADIQAIQRFNKKTDPNVIVDEGWLGTQTLQLNYPTITNYFVVEQKKNYPEDALVPLIWGNKRFVILKKISNEISKELNRVAQLDPSAPDTEQIFRKDPTPTYLIPYNPTIHNSKFTFDINAFKAFILLGQTVTPETNAEGVNDETKKKATEKKTKQNQTELRNSINGR